MFHYLQNLQHSVSRPRRRRQLRSRPVSCEAFETRLVLSAVTVLSAFEQLSVDADAASPVSVDVPEYSAAALQDAGPQPVSVSDSSAPEFGSANVLAIQNDSVPPQPEISPLLSGGQQDNPPFRAPFPAGAFDAFFGDLAQTGIMRHPDQPPRHRPPLFQWTDDAATDDVFMTTVDLSEQAFSVDSDVQPLTIAELKKNNDAVEAAFVSADGFVEIPRGMTPTSSPGGMLQDILNNDDAVGRTKLPAAFFDLSRESERQAADDRDSAADAAMAFFNRQSDGGFVDAELDDLRAAAGIAEVHRSTNLATSLEAGLGRFNPFDDRSHTTVLTTVELRHVAESDTETGRDGDHSVVADAALAGVVLGTVGLRNRSLERLLETFRRIATWLESLFLSAR